MKGSVIVACLVLLAPAALASPALEHLDQASACLRRGVINCALQEADAALSKMTHETPKKLRREALELKAEALALMKQEGEALKACQALLALSPGWRPDDEADPRLHACAEEARALPHLKPRLSPWSREIRPCPPTAHRHGPNSGPIPPRSEGSAPSTRWSISIGGGLAIPYPYDPLRFTPGPAATIDVSYRVWERLHLWSQVTLSRLGIDTSVPVEPGFNRGLSITSGVLGLAYSLPLLDWLEAYAALGLGAGGFGFSLDETIAGFALESSLGLRIFVDAHLAVRVDAIPSVVLPTQGTEPGGHISLVARCEFLF